MSEEREMTVFSQKINSELKNELNTMIADYKETGKGTNADEFIQDLVSVYKLYKLGNEVGSTSGDIKELNQHIGRIYDIYTNLVSRMNTDNKSLQDKYMEQLINKDATIDKLRGEQLEAEVSFEALQDAYNNLSETNNQLSEEYKTLLESTATYGDYIENLKEQVKELQEYRDKYKAQEQALTKMYSDSESLKRDNEKLKEELLRSQQDNENIKQAQEQEAERIEAEHNRAITSLEDRLALDKEKALLAQERGFIDKLKEAQEQYSIMLLKMQEEQNKAYKEDKKKTPVDAEENGVAPKKRGRKKKVIEETAGTLENIPE